MTIFPKIIAHRGNSALCHENTMAAFERAVADGADGIEFDLRLTKDRRWVIHHDADIPVDGRRRLIMQMTVKEISAVRVGPKADPIPTLTEFLGWAKSRDIRLVFDIKDTGGIPELIAAVEAAAPPQPPVFSAFRRSVLRDIRRQRPDWKIALIVGGVRSALARRLWLGAILRWARRHNLHALHLHERWMTLTTIARVKDAGLNLAVWTVDDPARVAVLAALGVDSIITNRPDVGTKTVKALA